MRFRLAENGTLILRSDFSQGVIYHLRLGGGQGGREVRGLCICRKGGGRWRMGGSGGLRMEG